ncbi:MBL fold metallo-hydrolase [Janthinobacterium aestuarii]
MYQAGNGDAFLLVKNDPDPYAILIDGGYPVTFKNFIRSDLEILAAKGFKLDVVLATHLDADHISGLLEFFKQNGKADAPNIISVGQVWHNSLRSVSSLAPAILSALNTGDRQILQAICQRGMPAPSGAKIPSEISARHASSLGALLLGGGYDWNMSEGKGRIVEGVFQRFGDQLSIEVIGPPPERLDKLKACWLAAMRKLGFTGAVVGGPEFDDAYEFLSTYDDLRAAVHLAPKQIRGSTSDELSKRHEPDPSLANGSSIAVILHVMGAKLLFLGDAWASDIHSYLSRTYVGEHPVQFDVIKISHHGSALNTSVELLKLADAPVYLVSTDGGGHDHPDFSVLKAIVDRPSAYQRRLYFSHSTPASRRLKQYASQNSLNVEINENANNWIQIN